MWFILHQLKCRALPKSRIWNSLAAVLCPTTVFFWWLILVPIVLKPDGLPHLLCHPENKAPFPWTCIAPSLVGAGAVISLFWGYLLLKWLWSWWHMSWCSRAEIEVGNESPEWRRKWNLLLGKWFSCTPHEYSSFSPGPFPAKISQPQLSNRCFSAFVSLSWQLSCSSISWRVSGLTLPWLQRQREAEYEIESWDCPRTRTALQTGTGKHFSLVQSSHISCTSHFTGVCGIANGRANTALRK